jgi:hypothetical protein
VYLGLKQGRYAGNARKSFGRERHARLVTSMGTALLTLRFDVD